MTLWVARDPDLAQVVTDVGHRPEQRQPVNELARVLGVAADHERPIDPAVAHPGEELGEVGAVADHVGRQVRHGPEAALVESAAELDRRVHPLGRRGGHGHVAPGGRNAA